MSILNPVLARIIRRTVLYEDVASCVCPSASSDMSTEWKDGAGEPFALFDGVGGVIVIMGVEVLR